jgi:hypothetical protein
MQRTPFLLRHTISFSVIALLCSDEPSFAQSPPEIADLIGKWELFSVDGSETTAPREKVEIEGDRLRFEADCNVWTYTYVIADGLLVAGSASFTLMGCEPPTTPAGEIAQSNKDAITKAIVRSKVLLNGKTMMLLPVSPSANAKLEFHRVDW